MDGIDLALNEEFENLMEFHLNYAVDSNAKLRFLWQRQPDINQKRIKIRHFILNKSSKSKAKPSPGIHYYKHGSQ